jgi:hypothetical protein
MATRVDGTPGGDAHLAAYSERLDVVGWGLLLILTGALWLVPDQRVPQGSWLVGTGLLLLTLNGIRKLRGIRVSTLTTFLGVVALAAGLSDAFGVRLPLLALCFIAIGGGIILRLFSARTK